MSDDSAVRELCAVVAKQPVSSEGDLLSFAAKLKLVSDEAETKKWLQFNAEELLPALKSGEAKQILPKLSKLSKALESLVFLVNNKLSVADLAIFVAVAPTLRSYSDEERSRLDNVSRWFDHIQHIRFLSAKVQELKLDVPVSQKFVEKKEEPKKEEKAPKEPKKEQPKKDDAKAEADAPAGEASISRLDFRVGKILNVQRHPGADALYQEDIDVGEEKPRQVVSGLVKFVPIEEMKDRLVIVLCNLKAANMRGVRSEGMVIAASNDDHTQVQLVDVPTGSKVGERVTVAGENGTPDKVINLSSKDNVFKTLQEHLRTNDKGVAVFKDAPLVTSHGPCTVKSLFNAHLG